MKAQVNKELLIVAGVAILLIIVGAVLAGFGKPPLEAPILSAEVEGGKVILTWQGDGDLFEVFRAQESGAEGLLIATVNTPSYVDEPGAGTFYYKVRAVKGSQTSPFSNEVEVTIVAQKPVINKVVPSFEGCLQDAYATFDVEGENIGRCAYSFDGSSWSEWMEPPLTVEVPEGENTLYIKCENQGVESDVYRFSFVVDRTPPTVLLNNPAVEEGMFVGTMESNEPVTCSAYLENGSMLHTFSIEGSTEVRFSLPFGKYLVVFECQDACGNIAQVFYEAENREAGEEEGKKYVMNMEINDGDDYTYERVVTLSIETQGVSHCRFTNEVDYPEEWSPWEEAQSGEWEKTWLLSEGYGMKKVYMECKDGNKTVGEVYDTIRYKRRGGGGNGGETANPIAGIRAYGEVERPALFLGLNTLPLEEEGIPFVSVPFGAEGVGKTRTVRLELEGVGEKGRISAYLGSVPVYQTAWDETYVDGSVMIVLPPIFESGRSDGGVYTYTIKQEVMKGGTRAESETTFLMDKAPPKIFSLSLDVSRPEQLQYYVFDVKFEATDKGSGIADYVGEVYLYDKTHRPIAHYAYYWKGDGSQKILIPPYGISTYYKFVGYVVDEAGNYKTVEREGSLPSFEGSYPYIADVEVMNAPPFESVDDIYGENILITVNAENAEACKVCVVPALSDIQASSCSAPYRPYTEPSTTYKLSLTDELPDGYEGMAYVSITCRAGDVESSPYKVPITVDLASPEVMFGRPIINEVFPGVKEVVFPYTIRDISLTQGRAYLIKGEGPAWASPCPQAVTPTGEELKYSGEMSPPEYVGHVLGLFTPSSTKTYYKIKVEAEDAFGRHVEVVYPRWVCPEGDGFKRTDEGNTGDEYTPGFPSESGEEPTATQ